MSEEGISRYADIINLPHHVSAKRPHMSMLDRAAQFAPFSALDGYDDQIQDTQGEHKAQENSVEEMNPDD